MIKQCYFRTRTGEVVEQCPNDGIYGLPNTSANLVVYGPWAVGSRWCGIHKHLGDELIDKDEKKELAARQQHEREKGDKSEMPSDKDSSG